MRILLGNDVSEEKVKELKEAAPGARVDCATERAEVLERIPAAEAYVPGPWDEEVFAAAKRLQWVHFRSAGVFRRMFPALVDSDVRVTNSAGVFAVPMAEHALALMLALSRGLQHCARAGGDEAWARAGAAVRGNLRELNGSTLGVLGYGGVGRAAAARARCLGMRVLAVRRHPAADDCAEAVWGPHRLHDLLAEADYLLVSCALTEKTRGMIGEREIGIMKPDAVLVNVARGAVVDEPALIQALRDGRLGAAGLDVTEVEPLPADSPLWEMQNVIVTPHVSGGSPETGRRLHELLVENVRRYAAGEPLRNRVDKSTGY